MKNQSNILVTGATGKTGRKVVEGLIKENQNVLGIECDDESDVAGCLRELIIKANEKYKQKVAAREAAEREADKIGKRRRGGRKQGGGRRSSGIPHYMQPKKYKQKIAERESNDGIPVRHSTRL